MKVTPLILRTRLRSCGKQFRDRSREKHCDESFQCFCDFTIFEISNFALLNVCIFAAIGLPMPPGAETELGC
jgi:hypothetical protein